MPEVAELLIGEFAQRCRLPVSTLRYYDRIGLLVPAAVDGTSNYRRYRVDQLPAAELIARLRALGVAPAQIAEILSGGDAAATALARERRRALQDVERAGRRLRELDGLLEAGSPARYDVTTVELTERHVAIREFSSAFEEQEAVVIRAIGELRADLRRSGRTRTGEWGGTFPLELDETVTGFVFAPVEGRPDGLTAAVLPGGPAVTTVHRGGPDSLSLAYLALFAEIDRIGATPQAPVIEEYLPTGSGVRLAIRFTP